MLGLMEVEVIVVEMMMDLLVMELKKTVNRLKKMVDMIENE